MAEKQDRANIHRNVHPPIVALLYVVLAFLLGFFVPLPLRVDALWRNAGFALTFLGFLFGLGALVEFRKARTTLDPHASVSRLVTGGIYRFTRNPIYLGFMLMVAGLPLNSGFYWGIPLVPLYMLTMNRLVIEKEEAYLEEKFKGQYTDYRSRVRRWL